MKLLLDTHAFIWWLDEDPRLSRRARKAIGNRANDVLLSVVSVWEIMTKSLAGRLRLPGRIEDVVPQQIREHGFAPLPLTLEHSLAAGGLPDLHRDPFDRMLVAQAAVESCQLVSRDGALKGYRVRIYW